DPDRLEAEGEKAARLFADRYVGEMKQDRLLEVCRERGYCADRGSEALVRALLEHEKRQVRGVACLALGQILRLRADEAAAKDPRRDARLRTESEKLFQRAAEKYADVKVPYRGTVAQAVKAELYELRRLAVGKPAPDVEGQDQDGKKFRLSDYKGKVVL